MEKKKKVTKVHYYVLKDESDLTIFVQDGGVGTAYFDDESGFVRSEYYQSRLTKKSTLENFIDELGEGKMYSNDWDGDGDHKKKRSFDKEVILDIVHWLYASTEEVKFVRKNITTQMDSEEDFKKFLSTLDLEEGENDEK